MKVQEKSNFFDHFTEDQVSLQKKRSKKIRISALTILSILGILTILIYKFIPSSKSALSNQQANGFNPLPIPNLSPPISDHKENSDSYSFTLRHIYHHNAGSRHRIHRRLDITPQFINTHNLKAQELVDEDDWPEIHAGKSPWTIKLPVKKSISTIRRLNERSPEFIESYLDYALKHGSAAVEKIHLDWQDDVIEIPNITDRDTVVSLATVSSNAYVRVPHEGDWIDIGDPWHESLGYGWESDGIRGHVFVSEDNSSVILGIKGTSANTVGGGEGDTIPNDKLNDNLLFSCCCARVSYLWTTVCDCYEKSYTCNQDCLEKELTREDRYYKAVLNLYKNVTYLYPNAKNIWVTGHSLGGALSSLLGRTYGVPAVAFEAPGEFLATKRLHLPMPPGLPRYMENIWHFGHTADPIFMGVCNGASSSCSAAGYAMETQCHTGKQCVYDVVTDKGWHVNMLNHRIHTVIDEVILAYNETAPCVNPAPCHDCFNWRFTSDNKKLHKGPTSSSTSVGSSSTSNSSEMPTPTDKPEKCLKRTWYGYCYKYGDDDGDDDHGDSPFP